MKGGTVYVVQCGKTKLSGMAYLRCGWEIQLYHKQYVLYTRYVVIPRISVLNTRSIKLQKILLELNPRFWRVGVFRSLL